MFTFSYEKIVNYKHQSREIKQFVMIFENNISVFDKMNIHFSMSYNNENCIELEQEYKELENWSLI